MRRLARTALLTIVLLLASLGTGFAECACLPLRVFTPIERAEFEMQYGPNWWQALGLIPGPSTPDDWVQRSSADSSITVYSPQQFWDPRACGAAPAGSRGPH